MTRHGIIMLGFVGTLCAVWGAEAMAADRQPPNLVIVLVDDMGVMDTSVPFLTDEAGRHRTTNWINPVRDNGGPQGPPDWNWQGLKTGDVTLAGLLQAAGYRTIHVGKGHFGPRDSEGADPGNLGFDINVAGASFGAPGSYYGQNNLTRSQPTELRRMMGRLVAALEQHKAVDPVDEERAAPVKPNLPSPVSCPVCQDGPAPSRTGSRPVYFANTHCELVLPYHAVT